MENKSTKRTKNQLKISLIDLLNEYPINKITISKLASNANINRGTFYLHYKDIYELLDELENDPMVELKEILEKYEENNIKPDHLDILREYLQYIKEKREIFLILLKADEHNSMIQKLKSAINDSFLLYWGDLTCLKDDKNFPFYCAYITSGCIGILENWNEVGFKTPIDEVAKIIEKIILNGLNSFMIEDGEN